MRRKPIPEAPPNYKPSSRKNTKRWCRGVVGREHVSTWMNALVWSRYRGMTQMQIDTELKKRGDERNTWKWEVLVCLVCGRKLSIRERPAHQDGGAA